MIWSDWKKRVIEWSYMDGSNRNELVGGLGFPNGVTIDLDTDIVYWCDAQRDSIGSIALNGTGNLTLKIKKSDIMHPFGIEVFQGYVYWSDWGKRAILKMAVNETGTKRHAEKLRENYLGLMGLRIYHKDRQRGM